MIISSGWDEQLERTVLGFPFEMCLSIIIVWEFVVQYDFFSKKIIIDES